MQSAKAAFDDIAASLGGGGQTLASSLGADIRTALTPSSGIVDKLSAYGAKAEAATNSSPFLNIIRNNAPTPQAAPPLPNTSLPVTGLMWAGVGLIAFILLRRG